MTIPQHLHEVSLEVSQQTIQSYAMLTNDYNPIHLDADFASKTPMGGVIAHGTMSVSLIFRSLEDTFPDLDFVDMSIDIKFTSPVRIGDVVRAGGVAIPDRPSHFEVWVRGQDDGVRIAGTVIVGERAWRALTGATVTSITIPTCPGDRHTDGPADR